MSLYKRCGTWHYDITLDGKRLRGSTHQRDQYLAKLVLNDKMAEARKRGVDALLRKPPVLKEFAVEFAQWVQDTQSIEPHTRRYYRRGIEMLLETSLAKLRMDRISNHECETVHFPGGPYNANVAIRTLRRMFGKAFELNRIPAVPTIHTRKEIARSIAMSQADAAAIAAHMTGDAKDAFQVLRATGMRPDEAFRMRWEYFHFDQGFYQNPTGKTKSARRAVPLLFDAIPILQRRRVEQGMPFGGWVFPATTVSGHIIDIGVEFRKARDKAGFGKGMVLYTARHGLATQLADVASLKVVMDVLGHTNPSTAMRYQHPNTADLQAKLDAVPITGRVQ